MVFKEGGGSVVMFNATFNNISVISFKEKQCMSFAIKVIPYHSYYRSKLFYLKKIVAIISLHYNYCVNERQMLKLMKNMYIVYILPSNTFKFKMTFNVYNRNWK